MSDEGYGEAAFESAIDPDGVACPICGKVVKRKGLGLHMANGHGVKSDGSPSGNSNGRGPRNTQRLDAPATVDLADEEERLGESIATMGMYFLPLMPHTGLVMISRAGDRELNIPGQPKPIKKRGLASVVMDYAKRDKRVLRAVVRFNNFMHAGDAAELALSIGAAVAVDIGRVDPHIAIPMPGAPEGVPPMKPIEMLIGDVVAQVESDNPHWPEGEGVPEEVGVGA
jgi:hypothetical protein